MCEKDFASLSSLVKLDEKGSFADHKPNFRIEEFAEGRWWILDDDVKVGLVTRPEDFVELVNWNPLAPRKDIDFPEIYHAPNAPGDRVTMAKWIGAQGTTSQINSLRFLENPNEVTVVFEESWDNGRTASTQLRFTVDSEWGYVVDVKTEMRSPFSESVEFCNFLAEHVVDDRSEFLRYPFVLWRHPDGIRKWNQNNIGARALGAMDTKERRRIDDGGFIGFFGEEDRNPVIEFLETSPSITAQTCPNMLDEHIMWAEVEPEKCERDEKGNFLSHARYRLFSVPGSISNILEEKSEMVDMVLDRIDMDLEREYAWCADEHPRLPNEPKHLSYCALRMGEVCDFEEKFDPASSARASVFTCLDDVNMSVSIVSDIGRSGSHSLRLRPSLGKAHASPKGTTIHVTPGKTYRLSAWGRAALLSGEANIELKEWLFSPRNVNARYKSESLTGTSSEWRKLSLEFTATPNAHGVSIILEANGVGDVWFDDILLEEIKNEANEQR